MIKKTKVNAAILIIGNEILSGRTKDTNTSTLATWLNSIGVNVAEVRVNEIINELRESRDIKRNKGGRISPSVPYTIWKDTPSAKILYKNVSLFPRLNTGAFKRRFEVLNSLPYEDTVTIC